MDRCEGYEGWGAGAVSRPADNQRPTKKKKHIKKLKPREKTQMKKKKNHFEQSWRMATSMCNYAREGAERRTIWEEKVASVSVAEFGP